jgi:hypothetical protein
VLSILVSKVLGIPGSPARELEVSKANNSTLFAKSLTVCPQPLTSREKRSEPNPSRLGLTKLLLDSETFFFTY